MVINAMNRRCWLMMMAACAVATQPVMGAQILASPQSREDDQPIQLACTWRTPDGTYAAGIVQCIAATGDVKIIRQLALPTRAHGVIHEPSGNLLVVARRPGEWLIRMNPNGQELQRQWIEPDRTFNGHAWYATDGQTLCTSETDSETGQGWIGVRDVNTLEKITEWPTHGMDPHELLTDTEGHWMVANGGIPTLPETGRAKRDLPRMDASLVRLHRHTGELLDQWRLDDPRLSIRHMAWNEQGVLGLALQAQHDDNATRLSAPILAWLDEHGLRIAPPAPADVSLGGYGGDIVGIGSTWVVSSPPTHQLAYWRDGQWGGVLSLPEACALAHHGSHLWAGGKGQALWVDEETSRTDVHRIESPSLSTLSLDNHWIVLNT